MTTLYRLPRFAIEIQCDNDPPGERGGHLVTSDLGRHLSNQDDDPVSATVVDNVTEALERTLLALACAGVDLNAPEFQRGFEEAVTHIADQQFS